MTIYRMYVDNGNRAGFWVQHRSWADCCALVRCIDGKTAGRLPGNAPHYGEAPIEFNWFDVRSGRPIAPDRVPPETGDKNYSAIATPWWSRAPERPRKRTAATSGNSTLH